MYSTNLLLSLLNLCRSLHILYILYLSFPVITIPDSTVEFPFRSDSSPISILSAAGCVIVRCVFRPTL